MITLESGQTAQVRRPNLHFMLSHPAHILAQGFGSGLSPWMPGTSGTLYAWLSYALLGALWPQIFTPLHWAIIIGIGFLVGIWACAKTGRDLGIPDHGSMVWDEIIGFWLVLLLLMPASGAPSSGRLSGFVFSTWSNHRQSDTLTALSKAASA